MNYLSWTLAKLSFFRI